MKKDTSRAHFTPRKVQNFQRSLGLSGPAYACPLCNDTFHQEPKLWTHARAAHLDSLQITGSSTPEDEEKERERFRRDAMDRASVDAGKKIQIKATGGPELPGVKTIGGQNAGQASASDAPRRPSTAPESTIDSERKIDDLGRLSIGKEKASFNPLKRVAGGSASPEPPSGSHSAGQAASRTRHTKTLSGGPTIKDSWHARAEGLPSEEYIRGPSGSTQRLFDPRTDDPSISKTPRRKKSQGLANMSYRNHPSRDHNFRQRKPSEGPRILQPMADLHRPQHPIILEQKPPPPIIMERRSSDLQDEPEPDTAMLREPETRPISHDQLVVEVKGIYAGLVMVEAKCIDIDGKQSASAQEKDLSKRTLLKNDQWQSLIALHKQLLHEHHDFFLASQHPSASTNLSKLAAKYSMPARMWRHGIHAFLEVLRHRLPESLEHMLAFIYIAYSMVALLYETVSTFEDTWIECLGDLGRYRMAIEEGEPKDREVWSGVARFWYSKAADKSPTVGRLYHHLAILARPYTLEQLSYYTRSLTCATPFESARGSIMTLFNPILSGRDSAYHRSSSPEVIFIKAHGLLFTLPKRPSKDFDAALSQLKGGIFDDYIDKNGSSFKKNGVFAAVSNIAALLEYGALTEQGKPRSMFLRTFEVIGARELHEPTSVTDPSTASDTSVSTSTAVEEPLPVSNDLSETEIQVSKAVVSNASDLAFSTFRIALAERNWEKLYILPMVHVMLVFLWSILPVQTSMEPIEKDVPWTELCLFLNHLVTKPDAMSSKVWIDGFPGPSPSEGAGRPLTEDHVIRGQSYTRWYYPDGWFTDVSMDDEERLLELPSMDTSRVERVLWLALRIAAANRWIRYDKKIEKFLTTEYVDEFFDPSTNDSKNTVRSITDRYDPDSTMSDVPTQDDPLEYGNISRAATESRKMTDASSIAAESTATTISDTPATPKAAELEEPLDVPMMDISPGREQTEPSSITAEKIEDIEWLEPKPIKSIPPPPPKTSDEYDSDPKKLGVTEPHIRSEVDES